MINERGELPDRIIVTGDDGQPSAVIDTAKLQDDAMRMMLELCATAGDDPATDELWSTWVRSRTPDEFGYLCAAVIPMMLSNVLAPVLDVAKEVTGRDFRDKLRELATEAGGVK